MTAGNGKTADAGAEAPLPAFLINLDRSPGRLAAMTEQLRRLEVPFRRVSAVDGRELGAAELKKAIAPEQIQKNIGRPMARGEIGCFLSHLKAFRIMVEENISAALVFEDDVALREGFAEVIRGWRGTPGHCRALQLIAHAPITDLQQKYFSRIGNVRFPLNYIAARNYDFTVGTGAYIIRRSYAAELLETAVPIKAPIDLILFDWRFNRYLPWILYGKRRDGSEGIRSLGVHRAEDSLLERERRQSARGAAGSPRIKTAERAVIERGLSRAFKALKKYFPLPLNRGRKLSFLDIASGHSLRRDFQVALSCLALPGRNREAELSAREKGD